MKKKRAFTLIELLVVIAIIALLLAILMPSLKKAKKIAKTVVCVTNCKTLSLAWSLYATENHERIVSSKTGFGGFNDHLMNGSYPTPSAWVDWAGYPQADGSDKERQVKAVERGALFPYVQTMKAYSCPASKKDQARCYVIPDILGYPLDFFAKHPSMGDAKVVVKTTNIRTASDRIVFLDEDDISYGGYTINYPSPLWHDKPPGRHNDGLTLGYADGHADYYKYRDEFTKELGQLTLQQWWNLSAQVKRDKADGNQDYELLVRGVYGTLGYVP